MRRDIAVTREAITKVTQILAGRKVKVTQSGSQAFVTWDRKGNVTRVNIPYLPDNASAELVGATQGYLDHEVAHILYTDPQARADKSEANYKALDKLHNMVEDCWIEPQMAKNYPGARSNMSKTRTLVFITKGEEGIAKTRETFGFDELPEPVAVKCMLVTLLRALAGHEELTDYMDEHDYWRFFPTVLPRLQEFFRDDLDRCQSSHDTLALARKVLKALGPSPEVDGEGGDTDDEHKKEDKVEETEGGGLDEEGDEVEDGEDDSEGEAIGDTSSGEKKEGKDEGGEKGEADDDAEEGGGGEGSDGESEEGTGEGEDAGEDEEDAGEGEASADGEDGLSEKAGTGPRPDMTDAIEDSDTFEDMASDAIADMYKKDASGSAWLPFTSDYDEYPIYEARSSASRNSPDLVESVRSLIGPMQKNLERLIMARRRSHFEPGRRSGRINSTALHRIKAKDDRIFRRKVETRDKSTAVHLVIDLSGSMRHGKGSRMGVAFQSAYALASTLERLRIPVMVSGFTTKSLSSDVVKERNKSAAESGVRYSIGDEANYQPIFKTWHETMNAKVTARFADGWVHDPVRHESEQNYNNMDPVSVDWAVRQTLARPEERHIVIVLSDGEPYFDGDNWGAREELKKVAKKAEAAEVEVIGIGIQTRSVADYYPKNVVINDVGDLPKTLIGELRKALLK